MKYVAFIVLVFTLASCRKKPPKEFQRCSSNCYIISGRVTDGVHPLPNIPLRIRYEENRAYAINPHFLIGATTTDQHGYFNFNFSANDYKLAVGTYKIVANIPGFFASPYASYGGDSVLVEFELDSTWIDKPYWTDLRYYRTAWLKVKLSDTSSKYIHVAYYIGEEDYSIGSIKTTEPSKQVKAAANIPTAIKWSYYRSGGEIEKSGTDTITLKEGEERVHEVKWK